MALLELERKMLPAQVVSGKGSALMDDNEGGDVSKMELLERAWQYLQRHR